MESNNVVFDLRRMFPPPGGADSTSGDTVPVGSTRLPSSGVASMRTPIQSGTTIIEVGKPVPVDKPIGLYQAFMAETVGDETPLDGLAGLTSLDSLVTVEEAERAQIALDKYRQLKFNRAAAPPCSLLQVDTTGEADAAGHLTSEDFEQYAAAHPGQSLAQYISDQLMKEPDALEPSGALADQWRLLTKKPSPCIAVDGVDYGEMLAPFSTEFPNWGAAPDYDIENPVGSYAERLAPVELPRVVSEFSNLSYVTVAGLTGDVPVSVPSSLVLEPPAPPFPPEIAPPGTGALNEPPPAVSFAPAALPSHDMPKLRDETRAPLPPLFPFSTPTPLPAPTVISNPLGPVAAPVVQAPTVGRVVHFVATDGTHCAAHVLGLDNSTNGVIELGVMFPRRLSPMVIERGDTASSEFEHINAPYSKEPKPGTWHWPERE